MSTLFTVAGTSTHNGISKARFANNFDTRIKTLVKAGHEDIELVELPNPMSKADAVAYMIANPGNFDQNALGNKAASFESKAKSAEHKGEKSAKTLKAEVKTPTKSAKTASPVKARAKKVVASDVAVETETVEATV